MTLLVLVLLRSRLTPQAYPAFTGGVSGSFALDLRSDMDRLAAVRLAEASNFEEWYEDVQRSMSLLHHTAFSYEESPIPFSSRGSCPV